MPSPVSELSAETRQASFSHTALTKVKKPKACQTTANGLEFYDQIWRDHSQNCLARSREVDMRPETDLSRVFL